jgi:GntR family transcriptional regulator/MocR family aminotransferase
MPTQTSGRGAGAPSRTPVTAAIQVACTDTPHGPCRVRTGMASRVNAASQPKTTTAQTTPRASVRPTPWTRGASVADLGYGDPRGSEWLRAELAGWLARTRGLRAEA